MLLQVVLALTIAPTTPDEVPPSLAVPVARQIEFANALGRAGYTDLARALLERTLHEAHSGGDRAQAAIGLSWVNELIAERSPSRDAKKEALDAAISTVDAALDDQRIDGRDRV